MDSIPRWVPAYVGTLVTLAALDFVFLGIVARSFYQSEIGPLLAPTRYLAAGLLYVLYAAGIVGFAVLPALDAGSAGRAAAAGALLGLVVYGVYDLTNLAVLKGWTVTVSVVDVLWGIVLTAAGASAGFGLARLAGRAM
jgi:uncharacterized membrane protein